MFAVTALAIIIGGSAGAAASVPVTNSLLESQVEAQASSTEQMEMAFGRGGMKGAARTAEVDYITEVSSAADLVVMGQLAGIGILLTVLSSCVSVVFIMRYDPVRILANRD